VATDVVFAEGSLAALGDALAAYSDPVAVVTGARSFDESGAQVGIEDALSGRDWARVVVEQRLPGYESAAAGLRALEGRAPGVVVAVGGGTVIDTAKLIGLALENGGVDRLFTGDPLADASPLVMVPTTAGSGAERTPFAVAYRHGVKHSIGHPSLRARTAIVDPALTYSMPRDVTVATGLDALSQAVESWWSTEASADSRDLSRRSLYLAWTSISAAADEPTAASRRAMAEAATTAGAAIATARTTAAHALSYHLTWHYGVPHGLAVALTLGPLLELNGSVDDGSVRHPGGVAAVRSVVGEIAALFSARDARGARAALEKKLRELGAPTRLVDVGVRSEAEVDAMIGSVNEERLANNPRRLDRDDLRRLLVDEVGERS
jgi:alcohol dehydrogenase class IV